MKTFPIPYFSLLEGSLESVIFEVHSLFLASILEKRIMHSHHGVGVAIYFRICSVAGDKMASTAVFRIVCATLIVSSIAAMGYVIIN